MQAHGIQAHDIQVELDAQQSWAEKVADRATSHRILSTLPYTKVPFWVRAVQTFNPKLGLMSFILQMLARVNRYDLVLLTGGERRDLIYAAIAGLCFWIRTPHVIVDAHWQQGAGWKHAFQRLLLRLSRRLVAQVQVHSIEEIALYHRIFGIPLDTLRAVPYSTSLIGHSDVAPDDIATEMWDEEPFILTGGVSFRDYEVFLGAAKMSGLRIKIGLPKSGVTKRIQSLVDQCPNVTLHTSWSNADYVKQMQLCHVFAMPIEQGLTRSTADQTILNAMHYGKIVVATDSIGPRIYISDFGNGFLVREATAEAWNVMLSHAFCLNSDTYERLGRQAKFDATVVYNEPVRLARTLAYALVVLSPEPVLSAVQW